MFTVDEASKVSCVQTSVVMARLKMSSQAHVETVNGVTNPVAKSLMNRGQLATAAMAKRQEVQDRKNSAKSMQDMEDRIAKASRISTGSTLGMLVTSLVVSVIAGIGCSEFK
jgi:hypothetical protein